MNLKARLVYFPFFTLHVEERLEKLCLCVDLTCLRWKNHCEQIFSCGRIEDVV